MGIIIGTMFAGQIKSLHGQYISTKVFILGLPIFPIDSILVTKKEFLVGRNGIEIPKNNISITAAFLRIWLIPLAALLFFLLRFQTDTSAFTFIGLTALAFIYLWFIFGRSTAKENFAREHFGKIFHVYFMPEWLYFEDLEKFQKAAMKNYNEEFGNEDWESELKKIQIGDLRFSLVYCTAYLTIQLKDMESKRKILDKKYEEYLSDKQMTSAAKKGHSI
jgi:hypothetical protein